MLYPAELRAHYLIYLVGVETLQNTSLYFALRASLRLFRIAPGNPVELLRSPLSTCSDQRTCHPASPVYFGQGREITQAVLPFTLRAALRAFKFAPDGFVLRAPCPSPYGPSAEKR
jgi:hypothetical protein